MCRLPAVAEPTVTMPSPDTPAQSRGPSRWYGLAVFLFAAALGWMAVDDTWQPNKWLIGDGAFYLNEANGILQRGSLRQELIHPHSWYELDMGWNANIDAAFSNIALGRHGEWWPKHPFLMPLVATPFIWAYGPIGSLVCHFLCYALIALLAYRIAARIASPGAALAAACALVATPWFAHCAWGFNNDVFYTVILLAAIEAALADRPHISGLLFGIGVFAKATNVLYGPALLGIFLLRKDWRGAARFVLWGAGPVLLYLALNAYMYTSPFKTGYDRILVRVNGKDALHSHSTDFHFANMRQGLKNVLLGGDGIWPHMPLFFPALLGLPLLLLRRWREAVLFLWCLAVPIAFHATYTWYRLEFNLPQLALAVTPLALLLSPAAPPEPDATPSPRPWLMRGVLLLAIALIATGVGRRLLEHKSSYLWQKLPQATVLLGDIPCDYFNNMVERFECSHFDNDDNQLTGRVLDAPLRYGDKPVQMVLLTPHYTSKARRLTYRDVPLTGQFQLRFGLADTARPDAVVHLSVRVNDTVALERDVKAHGLNVVRLDTAALAGTRGKLELAVTSPAPAGCIFGVDGGPVR